MDRARLFASSVGPLKLVVVVLALLLIVPFGTRVGGGAQEGDASPAASPDASPEASPVASPVAGAGGDLGSLTLRVLACDEATSLDAVDPAACDTLAGEIDVTIAGPGDPLTVAGSLRLSSGVFRWNRIPFGTYDVTLATLPAGYASAGVVVSEDGAPEDVTTSAVPVTIDATNASPTISIYLLPNGGA